MKTVAFSVFALAVVALIPSTASAEWYCLAKSPTGSWGEGWSPAKAAAAKIALAECAVRTPRGQVCVLTSCKP
jgi:hypothetical protein